VRLLQEEEQRATKKIADTKKKTQEIADRMKQNDHEFKQKLLDFEKSKLSEEISKRSLIE
jgi:hypothetical protein